MKNQKAFKLLKKLPMLPKGVVFVLNTASFPWGLYLAWRDGNCQGDDEQQWCGGAFRFPAQAVNDGRWFVEIENDGKYAYQR